MGIVIACTFSALVIFAWFEPLLTYKKPIPILQPAIFKKHLVINRNLSELLECQFNNSDSLVLHFDRQSESLYFMRKYGCINIITRIAGDMGQVQFQSQSDKTKATFILRWSFSYTVSIVLVFSLFRYFPFRDAVNTNIMNAFVAFLMLFGCGIIGYFFEKSIFNESVKEIVAVIEKELQKA